MKTSNVKGAVYKIISLLENRTHRGRCDDTFYCWCHDSSSSVQRNETCFLWNPNEVNFVYSSFNELCRKQSVWCPERRRGRLPRCYLAKRSTHNRRIMACHLFRTEYINALSQSKEAAWLKCSLTLGDISSLLECSWSQWEVASKEETGFYFESRLCYLANTGKQAVIPW